MKKCTLMLTVVMAVLFTGCAKAESNYEAYTKAAEAMETLKSLEMTMDLNVTVDMAENQYVMPMKSQTKMNTISDKEFEFYTLLSMDMGETSLTTESFYKDGIMYSSMMGQNYKMEVSLEDVKEQTKVVRPLIFEEAAIVSQTSEKVGEDKKLTFVLNKETMKAIMEGATESIRTQLSQGGELTYGFTDITATVVLDNKGNLKNMDYEFVMDFSLAEESGKVTFLTKNVIVATENVVINYPENLDQFIDINSQENQQIAD